MGTNNILESQPLNDPQESGALIVNPLVINFTATATIRFLQEGELVRGGPHRFRLLNLLHIFLVIFSLPLLSVSFSLVPVTIPRPLLSAAPIVSPAIVPIISPTSIVISSPIPVIASLIILPVIPPM